MEQEDDLRSVISGLRVNADVGLVEVGIGSDP